MIALAGLTIAFLKVFGKRPDRHAILFGCLISAVTAFVLSYVALGHLCDRGGPTGAVILGSVLAGVVRATIERKVVRRWLWIGWFAVTFWGMSICHLDGYIGNPVYGKVLARRPQDCLQSCRDVLHNVSEDKKDLELPKGWIEDSWKARTKEDFPGPYVCRTGNLGHYWHTWFTGVFSLETHSCGIWCPGGRLKSCAEFLEIRPRSEMR